MKKDKLIELLSQIKGNPDIYLWNGFVGDYVDVVSKFITCELVNEKYGSKSTLEDAEKWEGYNPEKHKDLFVRKKDIKYE